MTPGERLQAARNGCGYTVAELAQITNVKPATINSYENGRRPMWAEGSLAEQLADALQVELLWLLGMSPGDIDDDERSLIDAYRASPEAREALLAIVKLFEVKR